MKLIHFDEPRHTAKIERQIAKKILKAKPDAILFEFSKKIPKWEILNRYKPKNKPKKLLKNLKDHLKKSSKGHPQLIGTIDILENIEKLWGQGKQVYLYNIDASLELLRLKRIKLLTKKRNFFKEPIWIIWLFLRDRIMLHNIKKYSKKSNLKKIVVKCHNYHWKNLQFMLKNTSQKKIYKHYFGSKDIGPVLKKYKVLSKYWKTYGINYKI